MDATNPNLHVRLADFKSRCEYTLILSYRLACLLHWLQVSSLPAPLREEIAATVSSGIEILAPGNPSLNALNTSFLQQGSTTAPKLLAAARVTNIAKHSPNEAEDLVFQMLNDEAHPTVSVRYEFPTLLSFVTLTDDMIALLDLFGRVGFPAR